MKMVGRAIREYDIEQAGARTEKGNLGFKITVKRQGKILEEFHRDTYLEALEDFLNAGYKYVKDSLHKEE